ncbi:MAG: terpene cyclase/mutase family protein [Candidatus Firestonebacteria bacterium]|nr:terpene cyclase/mutase family protein [Candidatus Firestonebacteria bacterium]
MMLNNFIKVITVLSLFSAVVHPEAMEYLGTPASEKAADYGLEWLAKNQQTDGTFGELQNGRNPAILGFAIMAFLSGGHVPGKGKYGENVRKIGDYLAANQSETGLFEHKNPKKRNPMYEHGFATVAMCELYGMTRKDEYKKVIQKAVNLIISVQNDKGGWRYQPKIMEADATVTSCQIQALRAARDVGIIIPKETVEKAKMYIMSCSNDDGTVVYQPGLRGKGFGVNGNWPLTGAGTLSLMALGDYTSPAVEKGSDIVAANGGKKPSGRYYYGLYYCNQLMFQKGGDHWKRWFIPTRDKLISLQQGDGSFDGDERGSIGPVYTTAIATFTLQLPYSYLPIAER